MEINIRKETELDYDAVYRVIQSAFQAAEHRDGDEQNLVVRLRKSKRFIPELSLVAERGGEILGHILFTEITLGSTRSVALAPLAVRPGLQKQGVGTLLMNEGHRIAAEHGYEWSVVLGSETYYPRLGYRPASEFGISAPFDVPDANFMALRLNDTPVPCNAVVEYAEEFLI